MSRHDLKLPDLGIDDLPIVVSMWLAEAGDRVLSGDQVLEVLAGAATVDIAVPVDGILVETLVAEGEPLSVGQCLAVIRSE